MKRQHRIFFDLLRIIHRKQILKEDLDREFNRDKELKVIEYLPEKRERRCKSVQSIL